MAKATGPDQRSQNKSSMPLQYNKIYIGRKISLHNNADNEVQFVQENTSDTEDSMSYVVCPTIKILTP